jgi:hypothetical protein
VLLLVIAAGASAMRGGRYIHDEQPVIAVAPGLAIATPAALASENGTASENGLAGQNATAGENGSGGTNGDQQGSPVAGVGGSRGTPE